MAGLPTKSHGRRQVNRRLIHSQRNPGSSAGCTFPALVWEWKRAIQEGVDPSILANLGLGHYEQTVMPGAMGNTAYAGHRTPSDLGYADRLQAGDAIIIQTNTTWYVYTVQKSWIVPMSDVSVLDSQGDERTLTLTTCDPMYQVLHRTGSSFGRTSTIGPTRRTAFRRNFPISSHPHQCRIPLRTSPRWCATSQNMRPSRRCCSLLFSFCGWYSMESAGSLSAGNVSRRHLHGMCSRCCGVCNAAPAAPRVILYMLMWMAILFACWAWLCPFLASNVPWLETPYPGLQ